MLSEDNNMETCAKTKSAYYKTLMAHHETKSKTIKNPGLGLSHNI